MSGHWEILIIESHCTYNNINMLYFFFTSFFNYCILLYFVTYFYFQTVQHTFPFCYMHVYIAVKTFISLKYSSPDKTILNKVLGMALCLKLFKLKKKYPNAAIQEIVYINEQSSYSSKLVKVTIIMTILFETKRMLSTSLIRRKQRIADRLTTGCKKICDLQRFFTP